MSKLKKLWKSFPRLVFVSGRSYVILKNMRKELSGCIPMLCFDDVIFVGLCALSEKLESSEVSSDAVE